MNEIVKILDDVMDRTIGNLRIIDCPEIYVEVIAHEFRWLRSDILAEDDINEIHDIINRNRHYARCMATLEAAQKVTEDDAMYVMIGVYKDAARRGFVEFREKVKEVAGE
jgi:ribosome-interacting GTPase 1